MNTMELQEIDARIAHHFGWRQLEWDGPIMWGKKEGDREWQPVPHCTGSLDAMHAAEASRGWHKSEGEITKEEQREFDAYLTEIRRRMHLSSRVICAPADIRAASFVTVLNLPAVAFSVCPRS